MAKRKSHIIVDATEESIKRDGIILDRARRYLICHICNGRCCLPVSDKFCRRCGNELIIGITCAVYVRGYNKKPLSTVFNPTMSKDASLFYLGTGAYVKNKSYLFS